MQEVSAPPLMRLNRDRSRDTRRWKFTGRHLCLYAIIIENEKMGSFAASQARLPKRSMFLIGR